MGRESRGTGRSASSGGRPKAGPAELMIPERYVESFFRDCAKRINKIASFGGWHFEAAKFLQDLAEALERRSADGDAPRRA